MARLLLRFRGMYDSDGAVVSAISPVAPGEVVGGRYRVGGIIGEGGMGVVLEATHLGLEAPVAFKIIRSDLMHDEEFVQRFVNEARAAALLKGEHIARVYDVGQLESGEPYLVMERLEGVGLETYLSTTGPLEVPEAVELVLDVCEGLAEAHALSLVHRDIKPANLFLSRLPDGRSIVKILDFGIAKRLADKRRRSLTNPARSLGSPWYMSPEQMMDPSRVDARTDIWSLGVLLFELLTNDHPFDGEGVPEVCAKVLNAPAPSIGDFREDVEPRLDAVIRRCLEKDPERRFPSVAALSEALLEVVPMPSRRSSPVPRSSRRRRSARTTLGSLAPLADQLRLRQSPWSGVLVTAGICVVAGAAATWFALANPSLRSAALAWPKLDRLELPGDPVLNPGPSGAPLAPSAARLSMPFVVPVVRTNAFRAEPVATNGSPEAPEPALTPSEIRRRTARYENWLRAQGFERVDRATVEVNNPY